MEAVTDIGIAPVAGAAARFAAQTPESRPVESTLETQPRDKDHRPSVHFQTEAMAELVESSAAEVVAITTEQPKPTDAEARGGIDVYA
jgi:hypothetical protein